MRLKLPLMARVHPLLALLLLGDPTALRAQGATPDPQVIRWWEGVAALGGVALVSTLDEPAQSYSQGERSRFGDQFASVARRLGQPEVFATVPGVMFLAGVISHRPTLRRAGERVSASLALAGALAVASKFALGRLRPNQVAEPYDLKPFSGADAFPSGHTTMAFALATALADELRRPWVTVGLMTAAAGTGWSRVNDNKHWLSDVVAGAALGVTAAQLIERRWTVFGWRISVGRSDR